jgi:hypothetical protein
MLMGVLSLRKMQQLNGVAVIAAGWLKQQKRRQNARPVIIHSHILN